MPSDKEIYFGESFDVESTWSSRCGPTSSEIFPALPCWQYLYVELLLRKKWESYLVRENILNDRTKRSLFRKSLFRVLLSIAKGYFIGSSFFRITQFASQEAKPAWLSLSPPWIFHCPNWVELPITYTWKMLSTPNISSQRTPNNQTKSWWRESYWCIFFNPRATNAEMNNDWICLKDQDL